jgi:hypothetical protein
MSINWTNIENALVAWVNGTSQIGGNSAVWKFQAEPQLVQPYITIHRSPPTPIGLDPVTTTYDGAQPAGQEIQIVLAGQREIIVTLECFSNSLTGGGHASEYLGNCLTGLLLPSQSYALWAAGLGLRERGKPQDLSSLLATAFQSRAICEVRFGLVDVQADAPTGYIDTVDLIPKIDGVTYPTVVIGLG